MERIFVDTGAWFAFANRGDPDHGRVRSVLESHPGRLLTSNYVFDETVTLCLYRFGHSAAAQVGDTLLDPGVVDVLRLTARDELAAWELFCARADKSYSFTDCTSFILLRSRRVEKAVALDDDFRREGFVTLP